ncbi:urea transporter [Sporosarcina sp. resist]|uniref:urea transporter n=1 Tax=Sporosarcina sp. resist TaxID=2762563 RepID=UPI00164D2355|nr:urea transporter [Sporosarcina sp. resist]QNK90328.1 urea transporter [Sporosarcina sp. resist]
MWGSFKLDSIKDLIRISLKGFSQVMLIDNAILGGLILLGIMLHSPLLGLMALLSSMIGTVTGKYCGGYQIAVSHGIYGFNAILSGIAVMLFLQNDWNWVIALFAAIAAALLMAILSKFLAKWNIPLLTFPFLFVTWVSLFAAYRFSVMHVNPSFVTSSPANWNLPVEGKPNFFLGLIKGVGEVFIIDSLWAGSLILIALFVAGWRFGVYAIIGTFVSWLTAYSLGVDVELLDLGLYNYNAVLAMIAVGLMFDEKSNFPLMGIFAAAMTVPIAAGMDLILYPKGLPVLTSPFIISTWLFLAMRRTIPIFEPQITEK